MKKIFIAHSSSFDFQNDLYEPIKKSFNSVEYEFLFPQDTNVGFEKVTREKVQECDLVIAEVSFPSIGEGIVLGWADSKDIPVICIYKKDSNPSGTLQYLAKSMVEYTDTEDMLNQIKEALIS
jgi:nucleoside 2-deoxyribosyltransferase